MTKFKVINEDHLYHEREGESVVNISSIVALKIDGEIVNFEPNEVEEIEEVTITLEEYNRLLNDSEFLICLQACGVDNWGGYNDAWQMMEEGEEK